MSKQLSAAEAARERRLRRRAAAQGLQLMKSRCRESQGFVYGTYGLVHLDLNAWVASCGGGGYGLDLDEIEDWLT